MHHGAEGDYAKALGDLDKVLELQPGELRALRFRAMARHGLEDYEGAVEDFSAVLKQAPRQAGVWLARSKAWEEIGDQEKAAADRLKAVSLNPALGEEP